MRSTMQPLPSERHGASALRVQPGSPVYSFGGLPVRSLVEPPANRNPLQPPSGRVHVRQTLVNLCLHLRPPEAARAGSKPHYRQAVPNNARCPQRNMELSQKV